MVDAAASVVLLAERPELIPVVGRIRWLDWGHPPEPQKLSWWVDITRDEAGRAGLPLTWVALDTRGDALGAVGLGEFDIPEREDRSPWVMGMIVRRDVRGLGIGGLLIDALTAWAGERAFREVWAATERAAGFYQRCGWEPTEVVEREARLPATVLRRDLGSSAVTSGATS